jgi:hypothetical protein
MKYSWQSQTPVDLTKKSRNFLCLDVELPFRRTRGKKAPGIPFKSRRKSKFVLRSKIRRNCDAVTMLRI